MKRIALSALAASLLLGSPALVLADPLPAPPAPDKNGKKVKKKKNVKKDEKKEAEKTKEAPPKAE